MPEWLVTLNDRVSNWFSTIIIYFLRPLADYTNNNAQCHEFQNAVHITKAIRNITQQTRLETTQIIHMHWTWFQICFSA